MTEVAAALGLSADSSGLTSAVKELRNIDSAARAAVEGAAAFMRAANQLDGAASSQASSSKESAAALREVARAAKEAAREQDKAEKDAEALARKYERVRSSIDPLFAASKRYENSLETLRAATDAEIISTEDLSRLNDMAAGKFLALKAAVDGTAAAEAAAARARKQVVTEYERLKRSIDSVYAASKQYEDGQRVLNAALAAGDITQKQYQQGLEQLAQKTLALKNTQASASAEATKAAREQDKIARALDNTRRELDPVYAASRRYEVALENLNQALARGIINQTQFNALNDRAANTYLRAGDAAHQNSRAMNGMAYGITNASFQVQDFIVQIASGQDAMRAFAQQAPQLLGAMGFTGKLAMWGSIAGTVVAGAAAVYMAFRQAEDQAKDNTTAQEAYNESLQDYVKYAGSAADQSNAMMRGLGNISLNDSFEAFSRHISDFTEKAEGAYTTWERMQDMLAGRNQGIGNSTNAIQDMLDSISETMQLPVDESTGIFNQLEKLSNVSPESLHEVVEQVNTLDEMLRQAYGSMSQAPEGVQEFWRNAIEMGVTASSEIRSSMENIGANLDEINAELTRDIQLQQQRRQIAADYVSTMGQQARMTRAVYEYGEESAMVEALKDEYARDALATYLEQEGITGELADNMRAALEETISTTNQTDDWAAAMARVNAQLQGALALLSSIGGGMIQSAGIKAGTAVLEAGGTAIEAEKARRRREEELRLYNEQDRLIAEGKSSVPVYNMMKDEQQSQWDAEDAYQAQIEAAREAEREAARANRGGGGGRKKGKGSRGGKSDAEKEIERERRDDERAAERVFEQTRTNMERLKIEQGELNELYKEGYFGKVGSVTALDTLNRGLKAVAEQYDPVLEKTREWTDSMVSGFAAMITQGNSFGDTIASIAMKLAEMAAMEAFTTIFESSGIQKGIGSVIGSVFGVQMNAKGGVYNSPSLSAYSNEIVSKPTMFAFAKGAGLMGEAGPEAIMPLSRGPDGRLGVSAHNGAAVGTRNGSAGAQPVEVKILVEARPGDMFVPIVREIADDRAGVVVAQASDKMQKELPEKIAEHLDDPRYR